MFGDVTTPSGELSSDLHRGATSSATLGRMVRLLVIGIATTLLVSAMAEAQVTEVRACTGASASPTLEAYDHLGPGATFSVVMRFEATSRSWVPAEQLRMPFHHASALELVGFTMPAGLEAERVRLEIRGRDVVRQPPREGTWFVTYRVDVLSACVVPR